MHQLPRADHAPAPPSRSCTSSPRPTPSWPPASRSPPSAKSWASPSRPAPATFHRWINQYGGRQANDARRLPELERENARLKQRARDPARDPALLKEAVRLVGRNSTSSLLARRGAVWPATTCRRRWRARRGGRGACSVSRGPLSGTRRGRRSATGRWCSGGWHGSGVQTRYSAPGAPWEHAYSASRGRRLRDELLNRELFTSVLEAPGITED